MFPFRKVQLILASKGGTRSSKTVSIPQGTINTIGDTAKNEFCLSFHSARYN